MCIYVIYLNCFKCILELLARVKESSNDRKMVCYFLPLPTPAHNPPLLLMLTDEELSTVLQFKETTLFTWRVQMTFL